MTAPAPLDMVWTGGVLRPINSTWAKRAARQFVEGEVYSIADQPERSGVSHNHQFALIQNAWRTLPEVLADQFPTPEHLRKYCLIKAGFYDCVTHPCASKAEAQRLRAFIQPMDEFSLVLATEAVVEVYRAKSQSMRAMGKAEFQRSKDGVIEVLAGLLKVEPAALARAEAA
jgi:hypothetical protein